VELGGRNESFICAEDERNWWGYVTLFTTTSPSSFVPSVEAGRVKEWLLSEWEKKEHGFLVCTGVSFGSFLLNIFTS